MWQNIYSIVDQVGTFIGITGAFISFLVWLKVKNQSKKFKEFENSIKALNNYSEIQEFYRGVKSSNPKAFCLSLIPNDFSIRDRVEQFINTQDDLKKMPIIELNMDGLSYDSMGGFIDEVRKKRRGELSDATELHLFVQGPVIAGTILGAVFDHWIPVKLYHFNSQVHQYEYWGTLAK